ncbi:MAG: CHAT domain-containing protein, partial [Planctomycetota bacterium JB042]
MLSLAVWTLATILPVAPGAAEPEPLPLRPDVPHCGALDATDRAVRSPGLGAPPVDAPTRGRSFAIEVGRTGVHCVDLEAWTFDAYLVLRDASGEVVAEDDDGGPGIHARLVHELEAGRRYVVDACALKGGAGAFELTLREGPPPPRTPDALDRIERENAVARVDVLAQLAPGSRSHARALARLGRRRLDDGDDVGAGRALEHAVSIRRALGDPPWSFSDVVDDLSYSMFLRREVAGALRTKREVVAAEIERAGGDDLSAADQLEQLGLLLTNLGAYAEAERAYERAHAVRSFHAPDAPETGGLLHQLGSVRSALGKTAAARRSLAAACDLLGRSADASSASALVQALILLGGLESDAGRLDEARALHERAFEVCAATGLDEWTVARVHDSMGNLLTALHDLAGARDHLERALEIRERIDGPNGSQVATTLSALGVLAGHEEDMEAARAAFRRALAIREELNGPEHPRTATALGNLATTLPPGPEKIALHRRELAIRERTVGTHHRGTATALSNLALVLKRTGALEEARRTSERAVEIMRTIAGPADPDTFEMVDVLMIVLADLGRIEEAWALSGRDLDAQRDALERQLGAMSEAETFEYLTQQRGQRDIRFTLAELRPDAARAEARVDVYEELLDRKGRVARLVLRSRRRAARDPTPEGSALLDELRECQRRLSTLAARAGGEPEGTTDEAMAALLAERNRLEVALHRATRTEAPDRPSFERLRAALAPDAAVVDFFVRRRYRPSALPTPDASELWTARRLYAWITRPERPMTIVDLGPVDAIEAEVEAFLARLLGRATEAELRGRPAALGPGAPSDALRRRLGDPLERHLDGVETVFLSPDGSIGTLPFPALTDADGRFLIERFAFVQTLGVAELADAPPPDGRAFDDLLVVGGVEFGGDWPALPATLDEARAVARLHTRVAPPGARRTVLTGADPTEVRLADELGRHDVLHLATHGFFRDGEEGKWARRAPGLLSGLVCARGDGRPTGAADGDLTAEEVAWLDLAGVELVVLSACETGLGRARSGEGLIGLCRAFHVAGAKTV